MAAFSVKNVKLAGVSACVPNTVSENKSLTVFGEDSAAGFIKSTGIERRCIVSKDICTSDLCCKATEILLDNLNWAKESVDCLVFVTQSPDYRLPATSPTIQHHLGLSTDCYALDISLGCSGWVYGMSVITSLMSGGFMKRGLLLAGDTISKLCSEKDKSTYPLFGDAGTATALEYSFENERINFQMNTDGQGASAIQIQDGGCKNPVSLDSFKEEKRGDGLISNRLQILLEGMDVFSFGISRAPDCVNQLITEFALDKESIDYFLFHQANLFMNEKIRKKLKLPIEKVPYSLADFGNTSCATIPLTMVSQLQNELKTKKLSHIACGFGVGLSWGSLNFNTNSIVCPDLLKI